MRYNRPPLLPHPRTRYSVRFAILSEHRLRRASPRMVGSWSRQSLSSMLMVSNMRSGVAAAQVVMYWYRDFLRTTSWESEAAQLMT